jgi:hypothetical protein
MADDFDPDAYLKGRSEQKKEDFDPDSYLARVSTPVPITAGEKQFEDDKKLLAKYAGLAPDAFKAFSYSALNTALLNAPEHMAAAWDKISTGKDYAQALEEQRAYQKALERQHPTATTAGTVAGIGATVAVPGGALARLPQAAKLATTAKYGTLLPKAAEIGTAAGVGAGMAGTAATLGTTKDLSLSSLGEAATSFETAKDALIGAVGGGAAQAVIPALARKFSSIPKITDEAGKPTQQVIDAVEEAFGKGRYTPEEINDFAKHLVPVLEKKGITPEAVREAKLKEFKVEPTRSMTTGEKPLAGAAQEIAEFGTQRAEKTLGQKAEELIGAAPERTEIAEAIHAGALSAAEKADKKYKKMKKLPGAFTPEAETQLLGDQGKFANNIMQSLRDNKVPTNLSATSGYTQSERAMNYLRDNLMNIEGKYPFEGGLNAKNIDAITQDLNGFWFKARGDKQDQRAISAIKDGYLRTIKDHIDSNMFTGDGEAVLKAMKKAKNTWREMKQTYYPSSGSGSKPFNSMVTELVDDATGRISQNVTSGALQTAQGAINQELLNKKGGLAFYERLERALKPGSNEMKAVDAQLRNLALNTGGDLRKLSGKINEFLSENPLMAAKAFPDPKQRYQLKSLADNLDAIYRTTKSNEQKENAAIKAASKVGSFLFGLITGQAKGPIAGMAAYSAAEGAKGVGRGMVGVTQRAAEAAGAPAYKPTPKWSEELRLPNIAAPLESREEEASYGPAQPLPLTIRRASGGRVAAKLVSEVERAKKSVNNSTKALLNADDSHVARALEIANQNLEG